MCTPSQLCGYSLYSILPFALFSSLGMSLRYFTELERGSKSNLIRWLQRRSLLANPLRCSQCDEDMELKARSDGHIDGFRW